MKHIKYKNILMAFYFAMVCNVNFCQQPVVSLSNLLVMNHFEGKHGITKMMVRFDVSAIDDLSAVQVECSETKDYKNDSLVNLPIIHKDGKNLISFGKDNSLPISGKPSVIFLLDVREQLKTPYHYIRITGITTNGSKTNSVEFNKK